MGIADRQSVKTVLGYSGEDMKNRVAIYGIEIETVGRKSKKNVRGRAQKTDR